MDVYEIVNFSTYLSPIVLIGGVGVGKYYFKNIDFPHKIIMFYLLGMLVVDLSARFFGEWYGSNLVFIPILGLAELVAFSFFFSCLGLRENKVKFWMLLIFDALAAVYMLWEMAQIDRAQLEGFQSYSKIISTFLIVVLSINLFVEKIWSVKNISSELFYLNSVILMYFSMILIIFIPIDFLINDTTGAKFYIWFANLLLTLLFYLFLIGSIWRNGKGREW